MKNALSHFFISTAAVALAACATTQLGGGGSLVSGSAGQSGNAQGADSSLQTCTAPLGTVALVERQSPALAQYGLESPVPLVRLMAAQSGCFTVVERGQGLTRMKQERQLSSSGLLQQGSNVGQGQMVAADYYLTPNVAFSEDDAGAVGGIVAGLLGNSALGALVAGVKFKEAQSSLFVTDTRSGVQVAAAEGSARSSDLGGGLGLGSLAGFGGLGGGYSNTNEGKVVAGAFLDAFNKLVYQLRSTAQN